MAQREAAVALINKRLNELEEDKQKNVLWHYGRVELRELMDLIYEGAPKRESEVIK
jgi:hypothetical protein